MSALLDCRSVRFFYIDKGRNKGFALVFGAMPYRILKHRGWTNLVYRRLMVQAEIELVQQARRCPAYKYETIDGLIIDELNTLGHCDDFLIEANALCSLVGVNLNDVLSKIDSIESD